MSDDKDKQAEERAARKKYVRGSLEAKLCGLFLEKMFGEQADLALDEGFAVAHLVGEESLTAVQKDIFAIGYAHGMVREDLVKQARQGSSGIQVIEKPKLVT